MTRELPRFFLELGEMKKTKIGSHCWCENRSRSAVFVTVAFEWGPYGRTILLHLIAQCMSTSHRMLWSSFDDNAMLSSSSLKNDTLAILY